MNRDWNRIMRAAAFVAVTVLAGCAAAPADVRTTASPGANLAQYRTFTFVQGDVRAGGVVPDQAVRARLEYAIAVHLNSRGYTPALPGQAANLGVHFHGQAQTEQRDLMTGYPGLYDYRGGGVQLGGYTVVEYRQGTLIIDLFDRAGKELLWRATISDALTANYSEDNWKSLDRALEQAFSKLPSRR